MPAMSSNSHPPVGQDEPEYPAEGLGSAQEALQPVQGGDDVGAVVPLEQDVDLEPDLDEVEREQGLGVPLGALHAVHLDRTRALLLAEGEVVGVGAALVEGRLAAARALPAAPLVPDLLAQVHLGHVDVLVLDVAVEGALRAGGSSLEAKMWWTDWPLARPP